MCQWAENQATERSYVCILYLFLCTFFFQGEQTHHFKAVPLSWGKRAGRRGLWTHWVSWVPPTWLPVPIHLSKPPALQGGHTLLRKAKPSPCLCFPWCLMICICRIKTGKQYINVCANIPSLSHLLPLFTFIYIECRLTME